MHRGCAGSRGDGRSIYERMELVTGSRGAGCCGGIRNCVLFFQAHHAPAEGRDQKDHGYGRDKLGSVYAEDQEDESVDDGAGTGGCVHHVRRWAEAPRDIFSGAGRQKAGDLFSRLYQQRNE